MYDYDIDAAGYIDGQLPIANPKALPNSQDIRHLRKISDYVTNWFDKKGLNANSIYDIICDVGYFSIRNNRHMVCVRKGKPLNGISMSKCMNSCAERRMPMLMETYYKCGYNKRREYSNTPREGYKKTWIVAYAYKDNSDYIRCYDPTRLTAIFDLPLNILINVSNAVAFSTSTNEERTFFRELLGYDVKK